MDKSTLHFLLSRFMETEYDVKLLSNVSKPMFDTLKQNVFERFDGMLELTEDDVKAAWKSWFDWAASNGTLVSPYLNFKDAEEPCRHDELRVIDLVNELACKYIDKL